jgi:hypothetical protein
MRSAMPFARWRVALREGSVRFPLVLLCSAAGTASAIAAIHSPQNKPIVDNCLRVGMTVARYLGWRRASGFWHGG